PYRKSDSNPPSQITEPGGSGGIGERSFRAACSQKRPASAPRLLCTRTCTKAPISSYRAVPFRSFARDQAFRAVSTFPSWARSEMIPKYDSKTGGIALSRISSESDTTRLQREKASAPRFGSSSTERRISENAAGISFCRKRKFPNRQRTSAESG